MEDSLKQWLKDHNIHYILHTHTAVFTVPEAREHCADAVMRLMGKEFEEEEKT